MRARICIVTLAATCLTMAGEPPPIIQKPASSIAAKKYSREMLDQIRQSLTAQIAVRDKAENAMRAPTAEEAAALAGSSQRAASTGAVVRLKSGGVALHSDLSSLSFAIAETGKDGRAVVSHGPTSTVAAGKGGNHGR